MPKKIAAGNWKMNGLRSDLGELTGISEAAAAAGDVTTVICPPAPLVAAASAASIAIGGQDCHAAAKGAHTGDISAAMLADAGAAYVILGHSERRADHAETDADVHAKTEAAWAAGLIAIVCVGETLEDRDAGRTLDVVLGQLGASLPDGANDTNTIVAYEPVWAIGTGRVATVDQIAEVHAALRAALTDRLPTGADISLLYGGSVKASNAGEIFATPEVNGALVGGASLKASDFAPIIAALQAA